MYLCFNESSCLFGKFLKWRKTPCQSAAVCAVAEHCCRGHSAGWQPLVLMRTLYYTQLLPHQWIYLCFRFSGVSYIPVLGIILTVLFVRYLVREDISHGVSKVLYAISKGDSRISGRNNYASLIACTLTLGSRLCRSRGSDCTCRVIHRVELGQDLPPGLPDTYTPDRMRRCRGHRRNF